MLVFSRILALGLLSLQSTWAAEPLEAVRVEDTVKSQGNPGAGTTPNLAVDVSTSFPQSEIFGVKLVNGHPTTAVVAVTNKEAAQIKVRFIGGTLWTPDYPGQPSKLLRNFSTTVYDGIIPAGQSESFYYKFTTDMHPQDVRLALASVIVDANDQFHTMSAFNETVSVVEAPTSIFDPQILFLYLVLVVAFVGTAFFVYTTWISSIFPQQKKRTGAKTGDRVKTPSKSNKKTESTEQDAAAGAEGSATTTGSKGYDESWIPAHHIQRPGAKRIRSGTPNSAKTKSRAAQAN